MTLGELARLDPKQLPDWPAPAQWAALALLGLALLFGFYRWLAEPLALLDTARLEEATLQQRYLAQRQRVLDQAELTRQLATLQDEAATTLPDATTAVPLLTELQRSATARHLTVSLLRPGPTTVQSGLLVQPITLKLQGRYPELVDFADELARQPALQVDAFQLQPVDARAEQLTLQLSLQSYRQAPGKEASR